MDYIKIPGLDVPYQLTHLGSIDFEGMPQINNIREISPVQAGTRIISTFYGERTGTMTLTVNKADKDYLLNLFSPDRHIVFDEPFVYHKELRGGVLYRGNDGKTLANTGYFFSKTGVFVDFGGLRQGSIITINGVAYTVVEYISDSVILLDHMFVSSEVNVQWNYISATVHRTLNFYVDGGFNFIRSDNRSNITIQAIDIVAGNPFWLGQLQTLVWGDTVFRHNKAYPMQYPEGELYDIVSTIQTLSVFISSDIAVKPTIRIDGLMTTFRLDNTSQGTYIEYVEDLATDEHVIINLSLATAIKYPQEENVLRNVKGDLTTFRLLPFTVNELTVNTDAITQTSLTSVYWQNLYLGSQYDRV